MRIVTEAGAPQGQERRRPTQLAILEKASSTLRPPAWRVRHQRPDAGRRRHRPARHPRVLATALAVCRDAAARELNPNTFGVGRM
jgi:hypothetical protein